MGKWILEIPGPLLFLLYPQRYKAAYGGRGSAKSWTFARTLLKRGIEHKTRVLCAREVQRSIKDSVHKLLKDQIELEGLESDYEVLDNTIVHRYNGTEFLFTGLLGHTVHTLKSFEGVDVCWVEEGQAVTKRSWDVLVPTIRKPGSEIWVSFNPELETDDTSQRFIENPPEDCTSVKVSYRDNPWHNEIMEKERLYCLKTDPLNYPNIWEGEYRPAVEGAMYYGEMNALRAEGRICKVAYDPMLKVHPVFDLGHADNTVVALVQKHLSTIRIIRAIKDNRKEITHYSNELKKLPYNWGRVWLPHDGFAKDIKSPKSTAQILTAQGWDVVPREEITETSVDEGIRITRLTFPQIYIDEDNCKEFIEDLKRYKRRVNQQTGAEGSPVHDDASDSGDCLRYVCVNAHNMTNEEQRRRHIPAVSYAPLDSVIGI